MSETKKTFPLGDVLSITSGIALFGLDLPERRFEFHRCYDILNYLTRDDLFSHQIPRATLAVIPWLLREYPGLATLGTAACAFKQSKPDEDGWADWLSEMIARGAAAEYSLSPLPGDDWEHLDPLYEAELLTGDPHKILTVTVPKVEP